MKKNTWKNSRTENKQQKANLMPYNHIWTQIAINPQNEKCIKPKYSTKFKITRTKTNLDLNIPWGETEGCHIFSMQTHRENK